MGWNAVTVQEAGRVLFQGLCLAGGIIAPALTLTDPTPQDLAAAGATGVLSMLAGWRINTGTQEGHDKKRAVLPEAGALIRNHDLSLLVGIAVQRSIESAATDSRFSVHKTDLRATAIAAQRFFEQLTSIPEADLAQLFEPALPNIAARLCLANQRDRAEFHLSATTWETLVSDFAHRAKCHSAVMGIKGELVSHLELVFPRFVVEILKEDATGRGPTGGRGWTALTLLYWGQLFGDIRDLSDVVGKGFDELRISLRHAEGLVAQRLDEVMRWHGVRALEQDNALRLLFETLQISVNKSISELRGLLAHGLVTPETFSDNYWARRRITPGLEELWSSDDRAAILIETLVGRQAELSEFAAFLCGTKLVQVWRGLPGTGKSRLCIAFAREALSRGYRVYFVSSGAHDIEPEVCNLSGAAPIVLIWDDYQGSNPELMRTFLDLFRTHHGAIIKRVVTCWPMHNVLSGKEHDALLEEHSLLPIGSELSLMRYARSMVPTLLPEEQQHIAKIADGNLESLLRAMAMTLQGTRVLELPPDLMSSSYDSVIVRTLKALGLSDRQAVQRALALCALLASLDLSDEATRRAIGDSNVSTSALGYLVEQGVLAREGRTLSALSDGFRAHIIRRYLDARGIEVLSGTPAELAELARPFVVDRVHVVCASVVLATGDSSPKSRSLEPILTMVKQMATTLGEADAVSLSRELALIASSTVDGHLRQFAILEIGSLLKRYDVPAIAYQRSLSLYSCGGGLAAHFVLDEIAAIAQRHEGYGTALVYARALSRSMASMMDDTKSAERANTIDGLYKRYGTEELATTLTIALATLACKSASPTGRANFASAIAAVRASHDTAKIAEMEAQAVFTAAIGNPDPAAWGHVSDSLRAIMLTHNTLELAYHLARALYNQCAVSTEQEQRLRSIRALADLVDNHSADEIALYHALAIATDASRSQSAEYREQQATEVQRILDTHPHEDIAYALVATLLSAAAVHPQPERRHTAIDRITELAARFNERDDVAYLHAAALFIRGDEDTVERWTNAASAIQEVHDRHPCWGVTLELVKAIYNATVYETDSTRSIEAALRIGTIRTSAEVGKGGLLHALGLNPRPIIPPTPQPPQLAAFMAYTLLNANVQEKSHLGRLGIAEMIRPLLDEVPTEDIAYRYAMALSNAAIIDPALNGRHPLLKKIGDIRTKFKSARIAWAEAKALAVASHNESDANQCDLLVQRCEALLSEHPAKEIAGCVAAAHQGKWLHSDSKARTEALLAVKALSERYKGRLTEDFTIALTCMETTKEQ